MISMIPSQKIGTDTPIKAMTIPRLSQMEFFFTAEMTPIRMPKKEAKIVAKSANSIVAGKRLMISCSTGALV